MVNLKRHINLAILFICLSCTAHAGNFPWQPFSIEKLRENLDKQRITLIGFDAKWCGACRLLNRVTFSNQRLISFMHKHDVTCLHVDMTERNIFHSKLLSVYGGIGIPYTIILDGKGKIVNRYQGLFRPDQLIKAISDLQIPQYSPDDMNIVKQHKET